MGREVIVGQGFPIWEQGYLGAAKLFNFRLQLKCRLRVINYKKYRPVVSALEFGNRQSQRRSVKVTDLFFIASGGCNGKREQGLLVHICV